MADAAAAAEREVLEEPVTCLDDVWRYGSEPVPVGHYGLRRGHFGMFISASRKSTGSASVTVGDTQCIPRALFPEAEPKESLGLLCMTMDNPGRFLLDGTIGMFLGVWSYEGSLHSVYHLDQELRSLAFIPDSRVSPKWQCAVYMNGVTVDGGHSFLAKLNGRDKLSERHARIRDTGLSGHLSIDLDYVLMTWLGLYPTSAEAKSRPDVDQKVLVLFCDWRDSYRWGERLQVLADHAHRGEDVAYTSSPGVRITAESLRTLNIVLICRKFDGSLCRFAKLSQFFHH